MKTKDYSSVLIPIFKRKGAEGENTKIIDEANKSRYKDFLSKLDGDERGLIIYVRDMHNWLLITNRRLFISFEGLASVVLNSEISEVRPALDEEYKDGVMDKSRFTRLRLRDINGYEYLCSMEVGLPYEGIYQVLHFLMSNNVSERSH